MTDARRVADALAALADGTAPDAVELDHRAVVADAADAAADVRGAARFVAGGGRGRLRLAVRTAERAGDRDAAERGRRVLDALTRFRAAAAGSDGSADADHSARPLSRRPPDGAVAAPTAVRAAGSPSPRSRNGFTGRRSNTARRK